MSIFNRILERSKSNRELIGIWKYDDNDGFWCGIVLDFNETLVKIQHYTKYGKPDGIIICQISKILNVDFDDDYAKAIQVVINRSEELEKEVEFEISLSNDDDWEYQMIKQLEGNSEVLVSIEINDSDEYAGFIVEVCETDFILNCVGKLGEDEGKVVYKFEDVSGLKLNDLDNRKRAMLYKWRKTKA